VFLPVKGAIHSFESFGTVDGPGIRFVVFMQGCPLRCVYCHNRDMWAAAGGREYTADEVVTKLKKYIGYIKLSGGGITVTGGEPTLRAEFVTEVFKKCKTLGVHTALDTSGFVKLERVKELLKYTDLVLMDIKHAREEQHKKITGAGGRLPREFARYVSDQNIPMWIRYVLVPGLTDAEEDLQAAAEIIGSLKTVEKVDVLPYHSMGSFKWEKLGQAYPLVGVKPPAEEEVKKAREILKSKLRPVEST